MKILITITFILSTFQLFGQNSIFYKTIGKKNVHYIELDGEKAIVYKMGWYMDKEGPAPALILTDTLFKISSQEFKGKNYSLLSNNENLTLQDNKKKNLQIEQENNTVKVIIDLNNAYCLKSYFDLSRRINKEYPLYHYTFRNGYDAWTNQTNKNINHNQFIKLTDNTIKFLYDSISTKQNNFTGTTDYITKNVNQSNYSTIKDSLKTLPIDWRPQSGYFDKSVYQIVKTNPEYFYKLLQDFPNDKQFIWFAVDGDEELVKKLKQVQGYDALKKEFLKDYKYGKSMGFRVIGSYAIIAGLLTWLIIARH
jgi:hypothetical protein